MTFVDANVPMYLVGAPHPNKERARRLLGELIDDGQRLVTDAEVLQEILHRFTAIDRRDAIGPAWQVIEAVVDEVLPIYPGDVDRARLLVESDPRVGARDALHVAVMRAHGIDRVFSFDRHFDAVAGLARLF